MATKYWVEGVWTGKWSHEQNKIMDEADPRGSDVQAGERTCRSSDV